MGPRPVPTVTAACLSPPTLRETAAADPKPEMQVSLPLPISPQTEAKSNKAGRGSASVPRGPLPGAAEKPPRTAGLAEGPAVWCSDVSVRNWLCPLLVPRSSCATLAEPRDLSETPSQDITLDPQERVPTGPGPGDAFDEIVAIISLVLLSRWGN